MKNSKRKFIYLFLSLIVFSLFINLFTTKGFSATPFDINYSFENDILFNSTGLGRQSVYDNSSNTFNVREREIITSHFNATYSFENDIGKNGTDIPFITSVVSGIVNISTNYNSHSNNINFISQGGGTIYLASSQSFSQSIGIVEFWMSSLDCDNTYKTYLGTGSGPTGTTVLIRIEINNDKVYVYHGNGVGGSTQVDCGSISDGLWTHIKILFNSTSDKFSFWRNGILYVDNLNYYNDKDFNLISYIHFVGPDVVDATFIVDAIGYSWSSNYSVGNNLVPYSQKYSELENQYEVDKWQFRHNPYTRAQYLDGTDDPSGWFDLFDAEPGIDNVNTLNIGGNRTVVVHIQDTGGLYRNFNGINDTYYNITFNLQINQFDDTDIGVNRIDMYVKDSDNVNYLCFVSITYDGNIRLYYNSSSSIIGTFTPLGSYEISFFLNLPSQLQNFTMRDYDTRELIISYTAPFYNDDANDIDRIVYDHSVSTNEVDSYLMSISIYNTTGSISDDVAEVLYNQVATPILRTDDSWLLKEYNLIELYGNFVNATLFISELGGIIYKLFIDWSNIDTYVFTNIYEALGFVSVFWSNVRIWMYNNFTLNNISIRGVGFYDNDLNKYILDYTYGGVDGNISYFYVDDNNKMRFNLLCDDTNLEYIQAKFDIPDITSTEFAIGYKSRIDNRAYGFFRVEYTDISDFIPISIYEKASRTYLTQGKTVSSYIILITDDDNNNITGITTGYISEIELLSIAGAGFTITTNSLLNAMIPIIIIFIPTLLLSSRIGKNMIVPLTIIMSIVCTATEIIPYWLMFIIAIPLSLFMFLKRKEAIF